MIDIMTRTGNYIDDNLKEWKKTSFTLALPSA
jgi:hypothetical protein